MRRALFIIGALCLAMALVWPWITRGSWWKHFGRLPGDIHIERDGFSFHFPILTCILVSLVVSGLVWLVRRF